MVGPSARLLALLSLLQLRRDWPGQVLADRLEISPRTVRRDVESLRELGYRIRAIRGPDGGYRLDAGSELPPLLFDDDQAVALAVALQVVTATGADIEEASARALHTLRQVLPVRLRHRIDTVQVTAIQRQATRAEPLVDTTVLVALSAAVRTREVLRLDYAPTPPSMGGRHAGHGTPGVRRVEPHHLVTWGGRWYLVAWDLDRDDWRTFRVDRLAPRTPTGPRFIPREMPTGDVSTFVASRFQGAYGPDAWPCSGEVILALPAAEVSPYVHDGIVEDLGPQRCRLVMGSWSWVGLATAIGRFDADVTIVGPPQLRQTFARLSLRYANAGAGRSENLTETDGGRAIVRAIRT